MKTMRHLSLILTVLSLALIGSGCQSIKRAYVWAYDEATGNTDKPEEQAPPSAPDTPAVRTWLGPDISGWPVTATLTASVSGGTLHLRYDKASVWPVAKQRARDGGPLVGVVWVLVDGHAATWDWMRQGQQSKAAGSVRGTDGHIQYAPLSTWTPRSGETYWFMVSTPARGSERTINERSNWAEVRWP